MNFRRFTSVSTLSDSSSQSKKSAYSTKSSSSSKGVAPSKTNITAEEFDQMNKNLALMQYYNALDREQKTKKKEEILKVKLESARVEEEELTVRQRELEKIMFQLARMILLRESVKLGEKAKDFIKCIINPVTCAASVSLILSDSDFEKFKNILESIKSNLSDPAGRNLIENTVKQVSAYRPPDNFISTVTDVKMIEESKLLGQKINNCASTITGLKAEINKYRKLINQFKVESNHTGEFCKQEVLSNL